MTAAPKFPTFLAGQLVRNTTNDQQYVTFDSHMRGKVEFVAVIPSGRDRGFR